MSTIIESVQQHQIQDQINHSYTVTSKILKKQKQIRFRFGGK